MWQDIKAFGLGMLILTFLIMFIIKPSIEWSLDRDLKQKQQQKNLEWVKPPETILSQLSDDGLIHKWKPSSTIYGCDGCNCIYFYDENGELVELYEGKFDISFAKL